MNADGTDTTIKARGRHDPCVLPRTVPIVEAMFCLTILDYYLLIRLPIIIRAINKETIMNRIQEYIKKNEEGMMNDLFSLNPYSQY